MPDELLEKLVGVLFLDNEACGVNDVTGVIDELFSLWRELVDLDGGMVGDITQSLVDLKVGGKFSLAKSVNHAVEANLIELWVTRTNGEFWEARYLSIDVGVFVGFVNGINDRIFNWVVADIFLCGWERHYCGRDWNVQRPHRLLCIPRIGTNVNDHGTWRGQGYHDVILQ